jgi:hypothetical protein
LFVDVHQRRCKNDSHLNMAVGACRLPFKEVVKELKYLITGVAGSAIAQEVICYLLMTEQQVQS